MAMASDGASAEVSAGTSVFAASWFAGFGRTRSVDFEGRTEAFSSLATASLAFNGAEGGGRMEVIARSALFGVAAGASVAAALGSSEEDVFLLLVSPARAEGVSVRKAGSPVAVVTSATTLSIGNNDAPLERPGPGGVEPCATLPSTVATVLPAVRASAAEEAPGATLLVVTGLPATSPRVAAVRKASWKLGAPSADGEAAARESGLGPVGVS